MPRRRLLLGAGALALLAVVAAWTWLLVRHAGAGVTRENYERIREGMTEGQVVAILGRAPDRRPAVVPGYAPPGTARAAYWKGDDGYITVTLTEGGLVTRTISSWRPERGFLGRLRRLLPW
jgi:hypothetical protein